MYAKHKFYPLNYVPKNHSIKQYIIKTIILILNLTKNTKTKVLAKKNI